MSLHEAGFLFLAALVAGTINSVAGGGSFISFPALLFVRIAPISANATNTAAMWPGTIASTVAYWREMSQPQVRKVLPPLLLTGFVGGVIGATVLLKTPQATFMKMVPWLLLGATLLFVASGKITAWVRAQGDHGSRRRALFFAGLALELVISIYIGYFGAGAGILVLAMLALLDVGNIHAMNGLKSLLVSSVNLVALALFIRARVVVWPEAVVMLVGAAIGGYGGAYYAQKVDPVLIRRLVIVIGFGMSAYFFITQFA
ncbi:MAG TPA: sulfite exporter TauE/SafE family protein [Candidatus Acidoferrales bacterium]|nr:sulfite exporter TauE/SafE family protein [Candidatus Acidoferrales bacterium]